MVSLNPGEDEIAVAELARTVGTQLLEPAARAAERAGEVPAEVWGRLLATGLAAPTPDGGLLDVPEPLLQLTAVENLAYGDPGITMAAAWSGAATALVARHGGPEQVAHELGRARDPAARGAVALYEGHGRSPLEYATVVERLPGGGVRVSGTKVGVAHAATADLLVVVGRDPAAGALRAVALPPGTAGVEVAGPRGQLALRAAGLRTVRFDTVVDEAALLEADAAGLDGSVQLLRLLLAAALIGTGRRAVRYAADYATERVAFGRPLAGFQGVSFPLAESHARLEQARIETGLAAAAPRQTTDLDAAVSRAVAYATAAANEATRTAMQVLGGHGFVVDHPVELWYRSAAALSTLDHDVALAPFAPAL